MALVLSFSTTGLPGRSTAAAASFDCEKEDLAADEQAICDNRMLNDADVKMVTTFDILAGLLAMGARGTMQDDQTAWLARRQACGADVACIQSAYDERMKVLTETFNGLPRPR
ncbi:hypothetical protein GV67_23760 [Pseudorhizobium pelagicum]|uniref:Lysozyme inhibitor LprI N-terminal domain-containing protein n=1 Tax=Pseudorhizobium pelagicum TaxID=1509405 RepID=A0A922P1L7_9HYPH|nr:hypothetical protein GV67_23760 [Pseudorhizobium pelagicum]KEQ08582.1 hypothetical protein GV68_25625 [Pseudorhizobium pelagicum]